MSRKQALQKGKKKAPREEQSRGAEPLEHREDRMKPGSMQLHDHFNLTFARLHILEAQGCVRHGFREAIRKGQLEASDIEIIGPKWSTWPALPQTGTATSVQ